MKRLLNTFLCLGLLASSNAGLTAAGTWEELDESVSRKQIDTVAISIKGIERDLYSHNISANTLKADLTERLSAAGIRVIDIGQLADHPGADVITLRLTLNRAPYYFYLYGLNLSVRNRLSLAADGSSFTTIKTWSQTRNGMLMPKELSNIKQMTLQLLDNLIRAHKNEA